MVKRIIATALFALCALSGTVVAKAEVISEPGIGMNTQTALVNARTFSKMKCVVALMSVGVWPQVKAWLEANNLYDLYLAAQNFREDDAYFLQGKAALQALLGWTDEQVETLLAQCVAEE